MVCFKQIEADGGGKERCGAGPPQGRDAAPDYELRARTADGRPVTRRGARRSGTRTRRL